MPRRRGDSDNGSEAQEGGTFETMRDEGEHFVHVKQYDKAIESFTKALEMRADDKNCLVTRSRCYLQLGNAELALQDAENALEQDKKFIRALFQKAEALYQKGDFETALMFYHRGHIVRPELQEFRLGIQKSQEAINNSIGGPESVKLTATGDLSFFYKQEEAKKQQRGGYQKPIVKKEEKKERERPKGTSDAKTVKQLLGELYCDKDFLEKLLKDGSLSGTRNDKGLEIKDRAIDGLVYLNCRADFWRQQKPMYARKRDQRKSRASDRSRTPMSAEKITKILEEIDEAQVNECYQESLDKAKAALKTVEDAPDDKIQNKAELFASLYSSMGNAYLEMGKLNQALDHHEKDLQISKEHDLEDGQSRALDNLGRVHARRGDYDQAIEVWQKKIPSSKSALESTWLFHEIGRCYLEIGKFSDARDYGEKSLGAARDANDEGWQLHACVLVAQSEVKLGDYQAAADSFEKALEMAKAQNDSAAQEAIEKALAEVNSKIVQGVKEGGQEEQEEGDGGKYDDDFEEEKVKAQPPKKQKPPSPPPPEPPKPRTPTPPPPSPPREKTPEPRPKSVSIKEEPEEIPSSSQEPGPDKGGPVTEDEPEEKAPEPPEQKPTEEQAKSQEPSVEVEKEETPTEEPSASPDQTVEVKDEAPEPQEESQKENTQEREPEPQQEEQQQQEQKGDEQQTAE